jgi:NADPH:quinone reductase-like Zn-dependent oxidoreductase
MKAIVMDSAGSPEVLQLEEISEPKIDRADRVLYELII